VLFAEDLSLEIEGLAVQRLGRVQLALRFQERAKSLSALAYSAVSVAPHRR